MNKGEIWIIGGANIDIVGVAAHKLKEYDSNIGEIRTSFGGVGRNIAQACAELGETVHLVTCFGDDYYGRMLRENCIKLGIDIKFSAKSDRFATSTYLAILNEKRDMRIAMNDMAILDELGRETLDKALDAMDGDDILVIDSNLYPDVIEYITDESPAKIASDPVSAAKISRLESVLDEISIFKPNSIEAKELTGIDIVDGETAKGSLDWFISHGLEEIIITLGERGVLFGCGNDRYWLTHDTVKMENANGGGDAMFGAYLSRRIQKVNPHDALRFAIAAAVLKISGEENKFAADLGSCESSQKSRNRMAEKKEKVIRQKIEDLNIKEQKL